MRRRSQAMPASNSSVVMTSPGLRSSKGWPNGPKARSSSTLAAATRCARSSSASTRAAMAATACRRARMVAEFGRGCRWKAGMAGSERIENRTITKMVSTVDRKEVDSGRDGNHDCLDLY